MKRALQEALERGDADALRTLLERGEDVDQKDRYGQTALLRAARDGHVEALRVLIAHGAALDHTAKHGLSALMLAVVNGHEAAARLLVETGADTTLRGTGAPGFAGRTARDLAADRGLRALEAVLADACR